MKSLRIMGKCLSFTLVLLALLISALDAGSQTKRRSYKHSTSKSTSPRRNTAPQADGMLHLYTRDNKLGDGAFTYVPYDGTFKENKKTAKGPVIIEYTFHIDWPDYFDSVCQEWMPKVKEAINSRVLKMGEEVLVDVASDVDMTSDLPSWLSTRVSSLRYGTDSNGLYNGPLKNDLRISFAVKDGRWWIISKEVVTDLQNKTLTYESEEDI